MLFAGLWAISAVAESAPTITPPALVEIDNGSALDPICDRLGQRLGLPTPADCREILVIAPLEPGEKIVKAEIEFFNSYGIALRRGVTRVVIRIAQVIGRALGISRAWPIDEWLGDAVNPLWRKLKLSRSLRVPQAWCGEVSGYGVLRVPVLQSGMAALDLTIVVERPADAGKPKRVKRQYTGLTINESSDPPLTYAGARELLDEMANSRD